VIRAALDILWAGGGQGDKDGGWATAQQILDAAEVTVPTGDMSEGVYDSFGIFYQVPEHIVSDPRNLVLEVPRTGDEAEGSEGTSDEPDEGDLLRRREERGKKVVKSSDMMTVKARRSDGDGEAQDLTITVPKRSSVRFLTQRFTEVSRVSPGWNSAAVSR
jgi:hypothetical protein